MNRPFEPDETIKNAMPDFILCSSLLHELEDPEKMLHDIYEIANEKTVVHINVPNAYSMHRLLARESGLIDDVKAFSERNKLLQQNNVFDMEMLITMVERCGFRVIESGSYFMKPFTHWQMQKMLDEGIIDTHILDGLYGMSKFFDEYGSEIYVNCRI
nr:methyltransferase domain-containing protein [Ruminococcus sp.]